MEFKTSLHHLLQAKGMTLSQLSKKSSVSKSTLHGMLTGTSAIKLQHLKKIATALECSIHQLCYGTPDPFEQITGEVLRELFTGDLRVSISKIERAKK